MEIPAGAQAFADTHATVLWLAALGAAVVVTAFAPRAQRSRAPDPDDRQLVQPQWRLYAAALAAAAVFVVLALSHPLAPMQSVDARLGDLAAAAGGFDLARRITRLGDPGVLAVALGIGVAALLTSARARAALLLVLLVLANGFAVRAFKTMFERVRPGQAEAFGLAADFSFPSGHAAGAMMVFGALGWLAARVRPRARILVTSVAIALIGAIGLSRIALEVHHVSDVLAGFALGAAHLCVLIAMLRTMESRVP